MTVNISLKEFITELESLHNIWSDNVEIKTNLNYIIKNDSMYGNNQHALIISDNPYDRHYCRFSDLLRTVKNKSVKFMNDPENPMNPEDVKVYIKTNGIYTLMEFNNIISLQHSVCTSMANVITKKPNQFKRIVFG